MLIEVSILKHEQNCICECEHSTYPSANKWKTFGVYLICKEKYYFSFDSSAICKKCGMHIRTPKLYRSPFLLLIYGVAFFLITFVSLFLLFKKPSGVILPLGLLTMALLLFDRVFVAAVFTFFNWPTDDEMGKCSGKDAIWSKTRWMLGLLCSRFAMLLTKMLV